MRSRATLGLVVAVVLVACGGSDDARQPAVAPVQDSAVAVTSPDVPSEPVIVPLADGSEFDFNSLRNKDVLLWFWAPWRSN